MRLLTKEPQVEANAIITMNRMPDMLRRPFSQMLHIEEEQEPGGQGEDVLYHGPEGNVQHSFQYLRAELRDTIQSKLTAVNAVTGVEDKEYQ